ncbi:hypothetical protein [Thalassobaculum sp.]|uniref:hypothetical protein n=1 Tax=Thalassobaculum sp. TaxID=2022740 RepID=UPI0032ECC4FA
MDFDDLFLIAAGGGGSSRAANGNGNGGAGGIDEGEDGTGDYAGQGGTQLAGGPGGVGPHTTGEAGSQLTGGNASTASGTRDYGNGGLSGTSGDNGGGGAGKYGGGGGGGNSGVRGGTGGGGSSLVPAPGKMTVGEFVEFIEILEATGYAGAGTTPGLDGDTELGSVAGVPVAGTPGGDARICISEDGGSTWTTYDYTGADQTHVVGSTL